MTPQELTEAVAIAAKWKAEGRITVNHSPNLKSMRCSYGRDRYHARRNAFLADGLTATGEVRQRPRNSKPELQQFRFDPKLYHRAYMRLQRGKPIDDLLAMVKGKL